MKKVALIIAFTGFQPLEYGKPKEILMENGVEVVTVSDKRGIATLETGEMIHVDMDLSEFVLDDYDGIFWIGGPGALSHLDNEISHEILLKLNYKNKLFGAICISPRILAKAGVLKNRKATGWDGDGQVQVVLESGGAEYIAHSVVVDGNIITANGPMAAEKFGEAILKNL